MQGGTPKLVIGAGNPEAEKYGKLWARPEYRQVAPGEGLAQLFLEIARPRRGASVIDFGCGTGRGALMLAILGGLNVTMVDFVANCLDEEIRDACTTQAHTLRFVKADLEKKLPVVAEYGFCTDTMEHIPDARVDQVLNNILRAAQHVFFSISIVPDGCGSLIGETLHLSVHPYSWWLDQFAKRECVIHWSNQDQNSCLFYLTAWSDGQKIVDAGILNTEMEKVRENVRHNANQGWQQVKPHKTNDVEVMILGGGPSVREFERDIKQKREEGVKLVTLNGAYNWAIEHGLKPSAQIMVDARPFNARFAKPVIEDCKYLIASQCDPSVFEGLPKDQTFIWHTSTELIKDILNEVYETWWPIPGGSSVLLRAIPLLRMLGFHMFHLYGCDSCLIESAHHVYSQPENDSETIIPVSVTGGRIFYCHPWMIAQAQELMSLIRYLGNEIELAIYGDGLLKHLLDMGAKLEMGQGNNSP